MRGVDAEDRVVDLDLSGFGRRRALHVQRMRESESERESQRESEKERKIDTYSESKREKPAQACARRLK
jgi:hypothetical protein